jgi:hypothetical protein
VINTILNPRMNATEFSITLRKRCPCCDFNSSRPTPEIREIYPGTSGRTQGERKEINPAAKAASGDGEADIV